MGKLEIIIFWLFFSAVAAVIASKKGRSGFGFLILSIVLSPLIGIVCAALAKPNQSKVDKQKIKSGEGKACPFCAEIIKPKAVTCRYCGKDLIDQQLESESIIEEPGGEPSDLAEESVDKKNLYIDPMAKWLSPKIITKAILGIFAFIFIVSIVSTVLSNH